MNRTPKQWSQVKPDAFLEGSIVQARNVIEMMQQDIATLAQAIEELEAKIEASDAVDEMLWAPKSLRAQ